LNPAIDSVGIALVHASGVLYAVADYARAVAVLSRAQVEAKVGELLKAKGVTILQDATDARAYCSNGSKPQGTPGFYMLWQNPDIDVLPQDLVSRMATSRYRKAEVGSCPAQSVEGAFTVYRLAVILYGSDSATGPRPFYVP
jgi:hypothetical protein